MNDPGHEDESMGIQDFKNIFWPTWNLIENTKALYLSMTLCISLLLLLIAIQEESHFKTALFLEESKLQSVLCYIYSLKASL